MNKGLTSLNLQKRNNDVLKNSYDIKTIKTTGQNEIIFGQVFYDFTYAAINLIIFHRGLYSKESFIFSQNFELSIPYITTPEVVKYIRTVTEKIVNFLIADILEGFAFEECSRRTRERFVLKLHFYGSLNLTPATFEEFSTTLQVLKASCKSLLFDLTRCVQNSEDASSIKPIKVVGKSDKPRKKPKWKIITGLKTENEINSTWETNKIGIFSNDPDWEYFPWKKSRINNNNNNNIDSGSKISKGEEDKTESPVNELENIISSEDIIIRDGDPCFYYDCQDFIINEEDEEEYDGRSIMVNNNVNESLLLDDIRPLCDDRDRGNKYINTLNQNKDDWNISKMVESFVSMKNNKQKNERKLGNDNKNKTNNSNNKSSIFTKSDKSISNSKVSSFLNNSMADDDDDDIEIIPSSQLSKYNNNNASKNFSNSHNSIANKHNNEMNQVITIGEDDDDDMEIIEEDSCLNITFNEGTQQEPVANNNNNNIIDIDCGSPDMFEDPLEIFDNIDEVEVLNNNNSEKPICFPIPIKREQEEEKEEDKIGTSTTSTAVKGANNTTTTNNNSNLNSDPITSSIEKRMKMYSISSVQMTDNLMCNILLLKYPPRNRLKLTKNHNNNNNNQFRHSLKNMVLKKRRVLCFD